MTQFIFSNNASTTLTSAVTAGSTTLQVASGAAFPVPASGQQFAIWMTDAATGLTHEVMYVTANSANQFTVIRGQEGTAATSWAIGDIVQHVISAGTVPGMLGSMLTAHSTISSNYTIQQSDNQTIIEATGTTTITFPQGLEPGTSVTIFQNAGSEQVAVASPSHFYGNGVFTTSNLTLQPSFAYTFTYDGANWVISQAAQPGRFLGVQRFTSNGTYTPTAGAATAIVKGVGGGGAGGGAPTNTTGHYSCGAGGNSGAYGEVALPVSAINGATITLGAGGTGVTNAPGNNGAGTTVGSVISFPGGTGGGDGLSSAVSVATVTAPGGGVSTTTGTVLHSSIGTGSLGVATSGAVCGGSGGSTPFGAGGTYGSGVLSNNGVAAAANSGAGGSGAGNSTTSTYAGGNGGSGYVEIWEYS